MSLRDAKNGAARSLRKCFALLGNSRKQVVQRRAAVRVSPSTRARSAPKNTKASTIVEALVVRRSRLRLIGVGSRLGQQHSGVAVGGGATERVHDLGVIAVEVAGRLRG